MAKQPNQSQSGTNIQQVRQQNAQSAGAVCWTRSVRHRIC